MLQALEIPRFQPNEEHLGLKMPTLPDSAPGMQASAIPKANGSVPLDDYESPISPDQRKRIVVVGLGMVGVAFM